MSKVKALYHIVFCTKGRNMTITEEFKEDLYRFIYSELKAMRCVLYRIGGIANHVHMLIDLHPTLSLSELMKRIKANSSGFLKSSQNFPNFIGWASEYYACTLSPDNITAVTEYIKTQAVHHGIRSFGEEIEYLHRSAGLTLHSKDML